MKVLNWKISDKKLNIKPSAAVIGNFDGVHRGHLEVLKNAKEFSSKSNLPLSVLTFDPHPREFFSKEKTNFLLQTVLDKAEALSKNNIDYLINLKFDDLLSELSPEQFVEKVLSEKIGRASCRERV